MTFTYLDMPNHLTKPQRLTFAQALTKCACIGYKQVTVTERNRTGGTHLVTKSVNLFDYDLALAHFSDTTDHRPFVLASRKKHLNLLLSIKEPDEIPD